MGRKSCGRRSGGGAGRGATTGIALPPLRASLSRLEEAMARDSSSSSAASLRVLQEYQRFSLSIGDVGADDAQADAARLTALVPVQSVQAAAGMSSELSANVLDAEDASALPRRECQICFDELDALQAHECVSCCASFCTSCTRWYIEFKVLEGEVSDKKLVCPAPQCTRPLPEELVEAFLSPALFDKYKTFLRNQRTGIRFCPRPGCCAVLDEPLFSTHRRVTCAACEHESCMRCGGDAHALPVCRRVERRFGRWKKRSNVRACPRCKSSIEKNGGCAHMKCFHCDQEFCWSCLRPWESHDETLCMPLSFLHSRSNKFGCWAPLRVVTKTAVASAAVVVAVAGAGVAVVVLPPLLAIHFAKESYRRGRFARDSYAHALHAEYD